MDELKFGVLDIETIPAQSLPEECIPKFDEGGVAVGNLKDPFKIRDKIEEARAKFEADLDKRMSLDADFCEICCAVFMTGDGEVLEFSQEDALLIEIWDLITGCALSKIPLVTFNGMSFDIPVLLRRAIYNDVSVSPSLAKALLQRQEQNTVHFDLMQILGGRSPFSGKLEARSLDFYLKRFGIGGKGGGLTASDPSAVMDGSMVYPAWKEGRIDAIVEYCKQDVLQTAELFKRIAPWLLRREEK